MKNIQLVHEGEDYITISYLDVKGRLQEAEITGFTAIEAIKTMGRALKKKSFLTK